MWRQDSSLVAWSTQSLGVPGSSPAAADIFLGAHICSDPNCSNSWDNNDNRTHNRLAPHKKRIKNKEIEMTNMSMLTCKRSKEKKKEKATITQ